MDFVADNLFNGKRIRALTIVDNFSRECLFIHVDFSLRGEELVRVMDTIKSLDHRSPDRIQVDNGSEFISKTFDKWAYEKALHWISQGLESQPIMRLLNHLTVVFGMNV